MALRIPALVLSCSLGLLCFIHLNTTPIIKPTMDARLHACEETNGTFFKTLLCVLRAFFSEAATSPAGLVSLGLIFNVAVPGFLIMYIEGARRGPLLKNQTVSYTTIFGTLTQALGISVILPLLWLPAWIWAHKSSPRPR